MTEPQLEEEIAFAREKAKRTVPVALLVLLGLVAMYLPLPKRFVAFLPLVLAVVLTVRLLRFLTSRPGKEKVWPVVTSSSPACCCPPSLSRSRSTTRSGPTRSVWPAPRRASPRVTAHS